jgi:hypothetical protein
VQAVDRSDAFAKVNFIDGNPSLTLCRKEGDLSWAYGVPRPDNLGIQQGLAPCVKSKDEFLSALEPSPSSENHLTKDIYEVLGIHRKSTEAITQYIFKKLKKASQ